MTWRSSSYNCQSSGAYTIVRQDPTTYRAWHGNGAGAKLLGVFPTADAARAACAEHLEESK